MQSETKVSVPAIPNEQFNRLTNARSRSASNTNLPTTKSRVTTNPANSLKRMFEKKCSLLKKHSHDVKEGFLSKQVRPFFLIKKMNILLFLTLFFLFLQFFRKN